MKGLGMLSLRWVCAAVVGAAFVLPQGLHGQGPTQGIKLHGHWVIEVRSADGTVQVRREFDNALVLSGKNTLINLFTGAAPMGRWQIELAGRTLPCPLRPISPTACFIVEPSSPEAYFTSNNLTKTANSGLSPEFVLQGSFVAANDGDVGDVSTFVEGTATPGPFTRAALTSLIFVQATQTVSVTVTFTFS